MLSIRRETSRDIPRVRAINEDAFGQPLEADVVDKLRVQCEDVLSLVAEDKDTVVGHILFSPAVIESPKGPVNGMGLAPVAVAQDRQRSGVGSALIRQGLAMLRARGCPFVIVLGHPEYYPRFGFQPASKFGIRCQWDNVPEEAFMIHIFDEASARGL
ncbi:MAG TPA: N-acetyltransferase, partial [Candidatus Hydrogenedentes bacterium]|nr:N-acetyltransferase [Candidatus Hydrogenedentota bacterium]